MILYLTMTNQYHRHYFTFFFFFHDDLFRYALSMSSRGSDFSKVSIIIDSRALTAENRERSQPFRPGRDGYGSTLSCDVHQLVEETPSAACTFFFFYRNSYPFFNGYYSVIRLFFVRQDVAELIQIVISFY